MYELAPNTTLQNGKYRIIKAIGQGTFGITYLAAMQESGDGCDLEVEVAVKEFFMKEANTRNAQDESSVTGSQSELFIKYRDKFKTEAKNLEKMSRYGDIVKIYDVFDENNTAYFSMEYIDGVNLDDYIKQCGHIAENEAVEYIKKIATALKHLHDSRMLHLDLKPKNVMRSNDGRLYLIDFGLSKQYLDNGEAESSSTIGLGTAGYAPIEQANFKGGFAPTLDIYALGATFYKMLTGITAPESSDIYNNGFAPLTQQMQSCSISTKTISVVEKAMQLRKADRFQSVDEFLNAFDDGTLINRGGGMVNNNRKTNVVTNTHNVKPTKNVGKIVCTILGIIAGIVGVWLLLQYKSAKDDQDRYINYCDEVKNVISDLKKNSKSAETLILEKQNAQRIIWNDIRPMEWKHTIFLQSLYCRSWELDNDLDRASDEFFLNNPPFIVKDIKFGNTNNGTVIDSYGSKLYASNIKFLSARLVVIDMRGGNTEATFKYKVYEDGVLSSNSTISPPGYTAEEDVTLNNRGETIEIYGGGWGSTNGGTYTNVKNVRWEIWYDGKKIGDKTITLY